MVAFKIKNGLETGRYTSTIGTVGSGPDLDLSTGTYFQSSIGADTTFSFSNPPPSGKAFSFTLELSATAGNNYRFNNYLPQGLSPSVTYSSQYSYRAIRVKPDETSLFALIQSTNWYLQEFDMTTAGDINTLQPNTSATYVSNSTNVVKDFAWKDDGTRLYIMKDNGYIYYADTTAYTPTSVTSNSFNTGSSARTHFHIADSGTRLYVTDRDTDTIRQYSLSTAWDTTTATYVQDSPIVDGNGLYSPVVIAEITSLYFSDDGLYFYVRVEGEDSGSQLSLSTIIRKFEMSTAWDVSTATHVEDNQVGRLSVNSINAGTFTFNSDGSKMYLINQYYDTSSNYQAYFTAVTTQDPLILTWPSNVKWSGGLAPSAPLSGSKKLYNFFTVDGGTTYYGSEAYGS